MPSTRRRIQLLLPDSTRAAFEALAAAQDRPLATAIADMLHELEPQITSLAKLIEHAKAGRTGQVKQALRHMIGDAAAELATAVQPSLLPPRKGKR